MRPASMRPRATSCSLITSSRFIFRLPDSDRSCPPTLRLSFIFDVTKRVSAWLTAATLRSISCLPVSSALVVTVVFSAVFVDRHDVNASSSAGRAIFMMSRSFIL